MIYSTGIPSRALSEVGWFFRNGLSHGDSFQAPSNLHVRVRVSIQKSPILQRFLLSWRSVGSSETIYPTVVPSRHRPTYMLEPKITYPSQAPSEVSWIFRNDLSHGGSFQAPSNLHVRVRVRIQKSPILRRLLLRHRPSRFLLPKRSIPSQAPSNFHGRVRVRIRKPPILQRFLLRHRPSRLLLNSKLTSIPKLP